MSQPRIATHYMGHCAFVCDMRAAAACGQVLCMYEVTCGQALCLLRRRGVVAPFYASGLSPMPDENGGDEADNNAAQVKDYKLATLPALHQQLQYMNQNQLSMFERICEGEGVLAMPDWWQVRLGKKCTSNSLYFRKGGSST